jgi:hypothetical protein
MTPRPHVRDQGPAHERDQRGVACEQPADLAARDRRRDGRRTRNVPGQAPQHRRHEDGDHQRERVRRPPPGAGDGRTQVARQQDLVVRARAPVAVRPRPSQAQARARARAREDDLGPMRPRRDRHLGPAREGIAFRAQDGVAVEDDGHLSASARPQAVDAGARRAHLAFPAQGPFAGGGQMVEVGAGDVDGAARRRRPDGPPRVGHRRHQPRRRPQRDHDRQRGQRRAQRDEPGAHRAAGARSARQRGDDGEDHRGTGQGQRPHVHERPRPHRRPAQHREHDEPDAQGNAGACEGGDEAPHEERRRRPRGRITRSGS